MRASSEKECTWLKFSKFHPFDAIPQISFPKYISAGELQFSRASSLGLWSHICCLRVLVLQRRVNSSWGQSERPPYMDGETEGLRIGWCFSTFFCHGQKFHITIQYRQTRGWVDRHLKPKFTESYFILALGDKIILPLLTQGSPTHPPPTPTPRLRNRRWVADTPPPLPACW